jgi:hypothetical protein
MTITEKQMKMALGLSPARRAVDVARPDRTVVTLSVRDYDGGLPFRFEHRACTPFRTEAIIEATCAAARAGYIVWCLLDVEAIDA